jgi:hypothetical protein
MIMFIIIRQPQRITRTRYANVWSLYWLDRDALVLAERIVNYRTVYGHVVPTMMRLSEQVRQFGHTPILSRVTFPEIIQARDEYATRYLQAQP